jgi:Spy/CpxP family protein refolding chaperone
MGTFSISHNSILTPARRCRYLAVAMAALLAVGGSGMAATAHPAEAAHTQQHGAMDDDHLRQVIEFVMARIDEPQKEKVELLAHAARGDLEVFEQKAEDVRASRAQLLFADVVDRAALERARVAELHIADERSRRVNELLIDVATVLTPQQRARLRTEMVN